MSQAAVRLVVLDERDRSVAARERASITRCNDGDSLADTTCHASATKNGCSHARPAARKDEVWRARMANSAGERVRGDERETTPTVGVLPEQCLSDPDRQPQNRFQRSSWTLSALHCYIQRTQHGRARAKCGVAGWKQTRRDVYVSNPRNLENDTRGVFGDRKRSPRWHAHAQ